uniref:Uncharacterized protein n=1 Tax=Tanacetum cinerariifolium TaxID=118510 RepID=A0A6L2MU61_TANCI|nr:hypothetical protein [Tanacetum cinerariifolium]
MYSLSNPIFFIDPSTSRRQSLGVSASSKLFALAGGSTRTPISDNSCVVNSVREMYYGPLEQILEFSYMSFKTVLFRVKWFDTSNKGRVKHLVIRNNITQILANENDPDIIHVDNSSDIALTTTLNDLEISALHINGQSIDVDAQPDIIDVDKDDDIIDDEDILPHDLADFDDEDLVNVDDDDGMSADVARGHGGDDGGDDRPPSHESAGGCRGKGTWKPNLGGRKAGRTHTRKETQNLGLRKITNELGPKPIRFKWKNNATTLPLDEHSAYWANLLGSIVREFPMHFGSWRSIPPERKARVLEKIGKLSDPDIPRTSLRKIGMRRSGFGLAPRTWPGVLKMLETGQRARSYAGRDPGHLLPSKTCRPSSIPILWAAYSCGTRIDVYMVLAGKGKDVLDVPVPRCNHTFDVDELKRSNKQLQKQIDMIMKAMSSNDGYSQLFTQLQSQHESGSGSGCGAGEDDESGDNEDAGEDVDS